MTDNTSHGSSARWWAKNVIVPLIGGGGLVTILIAFFVNRQPPDTEAPGPPSARYEASIVRWFCVVKPPGVDEPYGACDSNRGDKMIQAGRPVTILVDVAPGTVPSGAKVDRVVSVTGDGNFSLFEDFTATYESGHIEAFVLPNDYGGFNSKITFTLRYVK